MLLAIDTATRSGTVAVYLPASERVVVEEALGDRNHAASLGPKVAVLLDRFGAPTSYAIDLGPGSFTGIRVGLAFLKGLARGRPAPVVGLSSLEILAEEILGQEPAGTTALPVLRASGRLVFAGTFRTGVFGPEPSPEVPTGLHDAAALLERATEIGSLAVAGEGLSVLSEVLKAEANPAGGRGALGATEASSFDGLQDRLRGRLREEPRVPKASVLARLAAPRAARGEGRPASSLSAAYHQASAAEEKRRGF